MGNGMNKVLPGLYVGNFRDSKDEISQKENNITHILAIHDNAKPLLKDKKYLCIVASDNPQQPLAQYFSQCNDFIHSARLSGGNVLVHCLAGVSRSVTVTVAYIMTVTGLGWRDSLNAVRGARRCANPNFGFQRQLLAFQHEGLEKERKRFEAHPPSPYDDLAIAKENIAKFNEWVRDGDQKAKDAEENNTYPLPHNAYSKRPLVNGQQQQSNQTSLHQSQSEESKSQVSQDNSEDLYSGKEDSNQTSEESSNQTNEESDDAKNANTKVTVTDSEIDAFFNK